jgi:hypothetical protein
MKIKLGDFWRNQGKMLGGAIGFIVICAYPLLTMGENLIKIENLANGYYRYRDKFELNKPFREVLFRKMGAYIIGSDIDGSKKERFCFKGVALGNKITQVIIAYQVMYPIPNQYPQKSEPMWRFFVGADIDFDRLYPLQTPPGMELYQCLELFSPNLQDF